MSALINTSERNIGDIISSTKKLINSYNRISPSKRFSFSDEHISAIGELINKYESRIIHYFEYKHNISFNTAFNDCLEDVFRLRMVVVIFIINSDSIKTSEYEDAVNNEIIDAFQNNSIIPENLNYSFIQTLEFYRDNENVSKARKFIPKDEFNQLFAHSIFSEEINHSNYRKKIIEGLSSDDMELVSRFENYFYNSLQVDFATIIYSLVQENKIKLDKLDASRLHVFFDDAFQTIKKQSPKYNRYLEELDFQNKIGPKLTYITKVKGNSSLFPRFQQVILDLVELKELEEGWDDDGSTQIPFPYIESAIKLVSLVFKDFNLIPTFTAPTVNSGVLVEYSSPLKDKRVDVRIEEPEKVPEATLFVNQKLTEKGPVEASFFQKLIENVNG